MKVIYQPRGAGKTTRLVKWLLEKPEERTIVVHSDEAKMSLVRNLIEGGVSPVIEDHVQTYDSLMLGRASFRAFRTKEGKPTDIAIDNVDMFIYRHFGRMGNRIAYVTISELEEDKNI